MKWSELSTPERYALIGGGFAIAGAVGFGVWFGIQSKRIASFSYELSPQEQDAFRRRVACNNDDIIRGAAEISIQSARDAGYDVEQNQEAVVQRMYNHLGLQPPDHSCP